MSACEHASYEEMSTVLFVSGHLTVMERESGVTSIMLRHLQVLMEDSEAYGW